MKNSKATAKALHMITVRELTAEGDEIKQETVGEVLMDIEIGNLIVNEETGEMVTKEQLEKEPEKIEKVTKHKPVVGG